MTAEKPKPKQLLRPIIARTKSSMNQSQFLAITCNSPEVREKSRVHGAIGFGFASHWLKNWRESLKPTTKRSNRNHVITFDSHLKTALIVFSSSYHYQPQTDCNLSQFATALLNSSTAGWFTLVKRKQTKECFESTEQKTRCEKKNRAKYLDTPNGKPNVPSQTAASKYSLSNTNEATCKFLLIFLNFFTISHERKLRDNVCLFSKGSWKVTDFFFRFFPPS